MPRPNFSIAIPGTCPWVTDSTSGTALSSDAKFCSEEITGVARRKPKGWIPPTGYTLLRREYTRAVGVCHTGVVKTNWSKYTGVVGSGRFNSLNHFNEVLSETTARQTLSTSKALTKARLKLKAGQVNLGVAFAERKATAMMLGDTTRRLALAVRETRRGNFRNAARALGIIHDPGRPRGSNWTNHWLQLQYGWKPLLSDVYGAVDALSKRPLEDWIVTATAGDRDTDSWMNERWPEGVTYPTGNYDARRSAAERQRGVFVRLDAFPDHDLKMSLTSLGCTNPLLILWEVVPYSFVVDWAIPIGNWLDSLDALLGYYKAYSSITTYNDVRWLDTGLSRTWSQYSFVRNDFTGTKRLLEVKRAASSNVPLPPLPRFKDPRSLTHMANGLSLLAGAMGRKLHPNWGGSLR